MALIKSRTLTEFFLYDKMGSSLFLTLVLIFLMLIISGIIIGIDLSHNQGVMVYSIIRGMS